MPVSGRNNAVIGQRCTEALQQLFALTLRIQPVEPFAVKARIRIFRQIFLEEGVGTVGFGGKFIPPQILCRIQCVLNACRVFGVQNSFEFNLFGFRHSGNPLCETIQLIDFFHAVKHIRCDLRYR